MQVIIHFVRAISDRRAHSDSRWRRVSLFHHRYYRVVAKGRVQCWALHAHDFHALHLADNAQHLKRAFQTHATKERQRVIMRPEDFLRFSGARETFPPDKYERLCAFLLALVTLNRLGRSGATADNPGPGPGGGAEAGAWDHIHFYEFVRFHLTIDRPTATLPAEIAFRLVDRTQRGTVTLASLRGFLEEFYGQREATEMLATMAVDAPQAMAVLLKSLDEPLSLKGFRDIYESLPKEVRPKTLVPDFYGLGGSWAPGAEETCRAGGAAPGFGRRRGLYHVGGGGGRLSSGAAPPPPPSAPPVSNSPSGCAPHSRSGCLSSRGVCRSPRVTVRRTSGHWLQREAAWHSPSSASRRLRLQRPCPDRCGDWSFDPPIALSVSHLRAAPGMGTVDWGVHRKRGAFCAWGHDDTEPPPERCA